MAALFDSSDEDEAPLGAAEAPQGGLVGQLGAVRTRVALFVEQGKEQTLLDLREKGDDELAAALENACAAFTEADYAACATQSEAAADKAWAGLLERKAWPHKCWNELFIFCSLLLACCRLAEGDAAAAVRVTDRAFIVGAPKEVANLVFRLVDPLARKSALADAAPVPEAFPRLADVQRLLPADAAEREQIFARLSPVATLAAVEPLDQPSLEALEAVLADRSRPRLLTRFVDNWPALERWPELDYIAKEHGHRVMPVEIGSGLNQMEERTMALGDFLRGFVAPSCEAFRTGGSTDKVGYLAQHNLFDQLPDLRRDLSTPLFCTHNGNVVTQTSVWLGTESTVTLLHYDSYDNFLVQVAGLKYVVLFPASESSKLYPSSQGGSGGAGDGEDGAVDESPDAAYKSQGNTSGVNVEQPDLAAHPLYKGARGFSLLLKPGDTLFIPHGMWHYVHALTPSLSVNFWFTRPSSSD